MNILVLAMSTLKKLTEKDNKPQTSTCSFPGSGEIIDYIGQLEPVPRYLNEKLKKENKGGLTHILILATAEAKKPLDEYSSGIYREEAGMPATETVTAVSFFEARMKQCGIDADTEIIDFDEKNIEGSEEKADGLTGMQKKIRALYRDYCKDKDSGWNLWFDIHGGFRDCSMAVLLLIQVLRIEGEEEGYSLSEEVNPIDVTGVYTVRYDGAGRNSNYIDDCSDFYKKFASRPFQQFMNYGQYLSQIYKPCDPKEGSYAFISYKHREEEVQRLTFFGYLNKANIRYWYDDGLEPETIWDEVLVKNIENCRDFVVLLTRSYFESKYCLKEIFKAVESRKHIVFVSLDNTIVKEGIIKHPEKEQDAEGSIKTIDLSEYSSMQQMFLNNDAYNKDGVRQESKITKDLKEYLKDCIINDISKNDAAEQ